MDKLKWKKKFIDDESSAWLEARVKFLSWTYVIDEGTKENHYNCFLFLDDKTCQEVKLTQKEFKNINNAKQYCENHLERVYKQFKKLFGED
jgi:hypothetical protein